MKSSLKYILWQNAVHVIKLDENCAWKQNTVWNCEKDAIKPQPKQKPAEFALQLEAQFRILHIMYLRSKRNCTSIYF
jgi:hypothetical protein